jgi:hypothetical protein
VVQGNPSMGVVPLRKGAKIGRCSSVITPFPQYSLNKIVIIKPQPSAGSCKTSLQVFRRPWLSKSSAIPVIAKGDRFNSKAE